MTQNDMVLHYMKKTGGISSKEAFEQLGITRLSARIFELKQSGVKIGKKACKARNRFNAPVFYDWYYIEKEGEKDAVSETDKG